MSFNNEQLAPKEIMGRVLLNECIKEIHQLWDDFWTVMQLQCQNPTV